MYSSRRAQVLPPGYFELLGRAITNLDRNKSPEIFEVRGNDGFMRIPIITQHNTGKSYINSLISFAEQASFGVVKDEKNATRQAKLIGRMAAKICTKCAEYDGYPLSAVVEIKKVEGKGLIETAVVVTFKDVQNYDEAALYLGTIVADSRPIVQGMRSELFGGWKGVNAHEARDILQRFEIEVPDFTRGEEPRPIHRVPKAFVKEITEMHADSALTLLLMVAQFHQARGIEFPRTNDNMIMVKTPGTHLLILPGEKFMQLGSMEKYDLRSVPSR